MTGCGSSTRLRNRPACSRSTGGFDTFNGVLRRPARRATVHVPARRRYTTYLKVFISVNFTTRCCDGHVKMLDTIVAEQRAASSSLRDAQLRIEKSQES